MRTTAIPEHRSIVVIDMAGSSRWDNLVALRARFTLRRLVRDAFRSTGIAWRRLAVEDRGDGMILLAPASVSKVDLLDPFIPSLVAGLRAYNTAAHPGLRIRVRVSVHAGEVIPATPGWVGTDVNLACRLVDGEPLYVELARNPALDLVLVASTLIYDGVIRHGYRTIDAADYAAVRVTVKEVDTLAWLRTTDPATPHRRVRVPSATHGAFEW